jgi:hemolysin III
MQTPSKFTPSEELANAYSHLAGGMLAIAGLVLMIHQSVTHGNAWHIVTSTIFGATMILLYFSSAMTHILPMGRWKDVFFNLDRIAIYFLIAGTYTPLALVTLGGPLGWVIFGLEWALALTGTLMILTRPGDYHTGVNTFYVVSYAVMGWMILIAVVPVIRILPFMGWFWILLGGLCYTFGILFFKIFRFRYHHLVWHLLVLAGSICHFFVVYFYVIPG